MTPLTDAMLWRHATKSFDPEKTVSDTDVDELLEVLWLSPSSYGLQPWTFIVVTDPTLKEKIRAVSKDQRQVTECGHLIVLCALKTMDEAYVQRFVKTTKQERNLDDARAKALKEKLWANVLAKTEDERHFWMEKQTYIALGTLLTACAIKRIDSCPMEGFSREAVDEILGLAATNLRCITMCPIGYRGEGDELATMKKVRWPKDQVIVRR
jgi:nitroreductase